MMMRMNFWILWMILSMFGITLVGWKQRFITRKLSGKHVRVTRIPTSWVKVAIRIATAIFAVLLVGECLVTFYYALGERFTFFEFMYKVVGATPIVALTILFYHFALKFLFNKARESHELEMKEELKAYQ